MKYLVEIETANFLGWIVEAENEEDAEKKFEKEDIENTKAPDFENSGDDRTIRVTKYE